MITHHFRSSYLTVSHSPLLIEGRDTRSFLNRLFTVNLLRLEDGHGSATHLLDSTGRITASLYLTHLDEHRWFVIPINLTAQELAEKLDMYLFGEDVRLQIPKAIMGIRIICLSSDLGYLASSLPLSADVFTQLKPVTNSDSGWQILASTQVDEVDVWLQGCRWARNSEFIELEWWGAPNKATDLLHRLAPHFKQISRSEAESFRLHLGAPDQAEYQQKYTPLDIEGSSSLVSISEGKGCYPGQEVIERTLALGQPARKLLHLQVLETGAAGAELLPSHDGTPLNLPLRIAEDDRDEVGILTSVSPVNETRYALAVVKRKYCENSIFYTHSGIQLRVLNRNAKD